jgi:translocation and assembly module TamB
VDFRYGDIHFTAERAHLDRQASTAARTHAAAGRAGVVRRNAGYPKSDEPFTLPSWPDSLPVIDLPLTVQADVVKVDGCASCANTSRWWTSACCAAAWT